MKNLEDFKQMDDITCDEINVKEIGRPLGKTEEGELQLVYARANRQYYFVLPHRKELVKDESLLLRILKKLMPYETN